MTKVTFITAIMALILFSTGCGSELTAAGGGLLGGIAASDTVKGIEADLERREQALIDRYNTALEAGAKADVLDAIEEDINKTVSLQQGLQAAKDVVGVIDETSGGSAGQYGAIAAIIASIGLNLFQKRKGDVMKKTTRAIVKGIEAAETETKPNPTNPVKVAIKSQLEAVGVYNQGDDLIRRLKVSR